MKNGRDKGFNYWTLNYRSKFIRTLWMIPFSIIAIILVIIADFPLQLVIASSLLLIVTLLGQLIYTYVKWQQELNNG